MTDADRLAALLREIDAEMGGHRNFGETYWDEVAEGAVSAGVTLAPQPDSASRYPGWCGGLHPHEPHQLSEYEACPGTPHGKRESPSPGRAQGVLDCVTGRKSSPARTGALPTPQFVLR